MQGDSRNAGHSCRQEERTRAPPHSDLISQKFRSEENISGYNKAKEEYRWNQWKAEEEKILREQGVDEETIQKLREYDWDDFNAERRFREHQTSLLDCMELLLEEKETKESQPESVEALLDTEEYTEAYY